MTTKLVAYEATPTESPNDLYQSEHNVVMMMEDTVRYRLRSTIPYDSNKAVLFVSRGEQRFLKTGLAACEDQADEQDEERSSTLTGDQAKAFYDEVLSLPEQKRKPSNPTKRRRSSGDSRRRKRAVNKETRQKCTTSHYELFRYAQNDQLDLLQSALSDHSHDINLQDDFSWTLLMVAACAGHMSTVRCLMGLGAKWREYTHRGMNAADLARSNGHMEVAAFIENYDSGKESVARTERVSPEQDTSERGYFEHEAKKTSHNFFCDSCQVAVTGEPRACHDTSIVHLYNSQGLAQPSSRRGRGMMMSYGIPETNRGFQMMVRSGWDPERGLGSQRQGKLFPVKTVLKQDRAGIGLERGKARVTHFSAHDEAAVRSRRDLYKKQQPFKTKRDILKEKQKERQWERRVRTIMNIDDSELGSGIL